MKTHTKKILQFIIEAAVAHSHTLSISDQSELHSALASIAADPSEREKLKLIAFNLREAAGQQLELKKIWEAAQ